MSESTLGWYQRCVSASAGLVEAERRFSEALGGDDIRGLAACDELAVAAHDVTAWFDGNPSPDALLGDPLGAIASIYLQMTEVLRLAMESHDEAQEDAAVAEVFELRRAIDRSSAAIDARLAQLRGE